MHEEQIIKIFRKNKLNCGLHGTSLWNQNYKDVDLLVFSLGDKSENFIKALDDTEYKTIIFR